MTAAHFPLFLHFFSSFSSSYLFLQLTFFPLILHSLIFSLLAHSQAGQVNFSAAKDTTDGGRAGILEYSGQESMDKALATLVSTPTELKGGFKYTLFFLSLLPSLFHAHT